MAAGPAVLRSTRIRTPAPPAGVSSAMLTLVLAFGSIPALGLAVAVARGGMSNPWVLPLAAATFFANVIIVLMDIRYGLALFIIAAGMSPKLPGIYDNLRVEDFIFVLVFGAWLFRCLQAGKLPPLKNPIVLPFAVLTALSILSTGWGVYLGTVPDLKYSFFLQAKRIEYFLIFYVVVSTIRSENWLRLLIISFVASGAIAAIYGLANPSSAYGQSVSDMRVAGPEGENYNTLSGYLVICICAGLAVLQGFPKGRTKIFMVACTGVAAAALLLSFSREGYLMLFGSLLVFGFTKQRKMMLGALIVLGIVFMAAPPVRENVDRTLTQIRNSRDDDPGSNSLTARYRAWDYRWNGFFMRQPVFGTGVGSVALSVDNEYLLRACEVGTVGFGAFAWWLASIWRQVKELQRRKGLPHVLAIGLAAGFVGLLIQGSVAASFNSIRTMEPFWFLLGLVTASAIIQNRQLLEAQCAS